MASQFISQGIGDPASIAYFVLVGLSPASAGAENFDVAAGTHLARATNWRSLTRGTNQRDVTRGTNSRGLKES